MMKISAVLTNRFLAAGIELPVAALETGEVHIASLRRGSEFPGRTGEPS